VHLFCSDRHAFALSRVFYPRTDDQFLLPSHNKEENRNNHRIASDQQFEQWWESVKIVRCHVPLNETAESNSSFLERCPICLDEELVSPFIAPCGHAFCLPCVLGYLNSVTNDLNAESDRIHKTKQHFNKGSSGVVGSSGLKDRASVTSIRARCPMCSSGSSMVLNAGEALITYKDLRPVVFVPVLAITAASVGEAKGGKGKKHDYRKDNSSKRGTRMTFVKLHRAKQCPSPYLPLSGNRVRGTFTPAYLTSTPEQGSPDLPDGDDDNEECIYSRQYFAGLEEYDNALQRDLDDLINYRENNVYCQMDSREDWNVSMAVEAIQAAQRRWMGSSGDDGGFRRMELEAKLSSVTNEQGDQKLLIDSSAESDNACTSEEAKPQVKGQKNSALLQPGSFHLQQNVDYSSSQGEADELLYYQSSDGQPCFLSGINVACLMQEFSLHERTEDATASEAQDDNDNQEDTSSPIQQRHTNPNRNKLPLPDELTGTVVEVEHLTVTKSLIKRKPFLSHLPLTSSVTFVEIDFYSGGNGGNKPMLNHGTLSKFRGELQRRESDRLRASKLEQKADKVAQARSEKDEQRRRRELLGSNYLYGETRQTINPDDEFFRAPTASFDESEEDVQWNRSATYQFNEVCATGGTWPGLSSSLGSGHQEIATDSISPTHPTPAAMASSSPPHAATNTWGSRNHSAAPKPAPKEAVVNSFPSLVESSLSMLTLRSKGRGKSNHGAAGKN